jgi:FkbM family methyltransferase
LTEQSKARKATVEARTVAGYVRAFTSEESRSGMSPPEQRARIEAHAAGRSWNLVAIYDDLGAAARPRQMPAFSNLLEDAAELFDLVIVVSLDRLGVSAGRLHRLIGRLREVGCELVSLDEEINTGDRSGQAIPSLLSLLASAEPSVWQRSGWDPQTLRHLGLSPATVIDVGVAGGTEALYRAFPHAHHVLIEPLAEFEGDLQALASEHGGECIMTAVGNREGLLRLNVAPDLLMTSALRAPQLQDTTERIVPVTTLDKLREARRWTTPFGLKLDVEGFESSVIEGAQEVLCETQFLITEISLTDRFEGESPSADMIELLRSHDFRVRDVIDASRSALGVHADVLFTRDKGLDGPTTRSGRARSAFRNRPRS